MLVFIRPVTSSPGSPLSEVYPLHNYIRPPIIPALNILTSTLPDGSIQHFAGKPQPLMRYIRQEG